MARQIGQYVAKDSSGRLRILWGQEWGSSCGPASCYMVCCSVRQSTLMGGEAFMRALAMKYGATIVDLTVGVGTYGQQLKKVLEDEGITVSNQQYTPGALASIIAGASERKPIIFNIAWYGRDSKGAWAGSGGHWVTCVGSVAGGAVILDPWYGLNEIPLVDLPNYNPSAPGQSLNPATATSWGLLSGWAVRVL